VDPAAMAQADTLDTRRGDLLQSTPQVNRWDTQLGTLFLISLDIAAKEPARPPQQQYHPSTGEFLRCRNPSCGCRTAIRGIGSYSGRASVSASGAGLSALANASTDGSDIISGLATVGTVLAMASFSIPFSLARFPVRLMARRLAAYGLEVGRDPTQRSGLQVSQTQRISARFQTRQTRHRTRATAPHHHEMV
jgi:hypothetical protein